MDPRKESGPFDLRALLEEHVFCPPVPVEHDGEAIGGTLERLGHPRCAYFEHGLEPEKVAQLEDGLGMALPDGVRLHAVPLNLTEMTPAGEFRGQAAAAFVTLGGRRLQSVGPRAERSLTVRADGDELVLLCEFHFPRRSDDPLRDELAMLEDPRFDSVDDEYVRGRIRRLRLAGERLARDPERAFPGTWRHGPRSRHSFAGNIREYGDQWEREATIATGVRVSEMLDPRDGLRWSHNGIRIPTRYRRRREGVTARVDLGHLVSRDGVDALWSADIGLSDRLRPDLVVSRDELHGLPWQIHSAAGLALRRAARADGRGLLDASDSQMFAGPSFVEGVLLGDVADDPLLTQPDGWKAEALFAGMSIEEIVSLAEHGQPQQVQLPSPDDLLAPQYSPPSFLAICRAAVVALNADIRWLSENPDTVWGWQCVVVPRSAPLVRALRLFPPLFSAEYIGSDRLKLGDGPVNRDHRFTVWLLDAAEELTRMYPGLLAAIRSDLCRHRYNEDMTKKAEGINAAVDRLRELNPGLAPPRSLKVAADDFA
jgi:hypothetical protein